METRHIVLPAVVIEIALLWWYSWMDNPTIGRLVIAVVFYASWWGLAAYALSLVRRVLGVVVYGDGASRADSAGVRFLSDMPIYEEITAEARGDSLGFEGYSQTLADLVMATEGPFAVGIQGDWGQGKTSLLRAIEARLAPPHSDKGWRRVWQVLRRVFARSADAPVIVPIRFNAWQFQHEERPLIPLLLSISAALQKRSAASLASFGPLNDLRRTMRAIAAGAVASTEVKADTQAASVELSFSPQSWQRGARQAWQPNRVMSGLLTQRTTYYRAFQDLYEVCSRLHDNVKLVLFIDDLDRCSPESALRLLEQIKPVLSQPHFIFFIALDPTHLEAYINHNYQQYFDDTKAAVRDWGREYFEKLLQVTFRIPRHDKWYDDFVDQLYDHVRWTGATKGSIKPLLGKPLGYNPRRTIAVLNAIILIESLLPPPLRKNTELIAVETILRMRYGERVYSLLAGGNPEDNEEFRMRVLGWEDILRKPRVQPPPFGRGSKAKINKELWEYLSGDSSLTDVLFSVPGKIWLEASDDDRYGVARLVEDQKLEARLDTDVALLSKATEAYHRKDYTASRKYFEELISKDENNIDAYIGLEKVERAARRHSKLPHVPETTIFDERIQKLWDIANQSMREKKYLRAEKALLTILKVDDTNASAFNRLGILYAKQQAYQDAIECFEIAASLEPSAASLYNLGLIFYEIGDYKKAESHLAKALKDGGETSYYVAYAKVLEKRGKTAAMIKALERAVELEPSRALMTLLADAYAAAGNHERARAVRQKTKLPRKPGATSRRATSSKRAPSPHKKPAPPAK